MALHLCVSMLECRDRPCVHCEALVSPQSTKSPPWSHSAEEITSTSFPFPGFALGLQFAASSSSRVSITMCGIQSDTHMSARIVRELQHHLCCQFLPSIPEIAPLLLIRFFFPKFTENSVILLSFEKLVS